MPQTYAVPPAPPHNEGKTVAAWSMTVGVVAGSVVAAFGLAIMNLLLIVIGSVVIVAAIIVSVALKFAGFGQKRHRVART